MPGAPGPAPLPPSRPPAMPPAIPTGRMAILFMVMLISAAGNTAMQSVLPAIGTQLGVADYWISAAFTWSALLWVITAPRWARLSDRRGRKALMMLGVTAFSISMLCCGLVLFAGLHGLMTGGVTLIVFALFRSIFGGFGSAAPPAVQAYVAARTDREQRTKSLSLIASSFGLGTIIGPFLAPFFILPIVDDAGPMLVFAAIGFVVILALRFKLPNDDPRFATRSFRQQRAVRQRRAQRALGGPGRNGGAHAAGLARPARAQLARRRAGRWSCAGDHQLCRGLSRARSPRPARHPERGL